MGQCFAKAQGGVYADPLLESIVDFVRGQGIAVRIREDQQPAQRGRVDHLGQRGAFAGMVVQPLIVVVLGVDVVRAL